MTTDTTSTPGTAADAGTGAPDPGDTTTATGATTTPDARDAELEALRAQVADLTQKPTPIDPRDAELEALRAQVALAQQTGAVVPGSTTTAPAPTPAPSPGAPASTAYTPPAEPTDKQHSISLGDVVSLTAFDPYAGAGGETRTVYGLVIDRHTDTATDQVNGEVSREMARVAWFREVSDPLELSGLDPVD